MLTRMLEASAARRGEGTALRFAGERLSYRELLQAVRRRAGAWEQAQLGPDRAVAILLPNGPDFVVELFAVAARGALAVPLDPGFKVGELLACLEGCPVAAVAADAASRSLADELAARLGGVAVEERGVAGPGATGSASVGSARVPWEGDVLAGFSSGSTGAPKRILRTQSNLVHEADHFAEAVGLRAEDVILGAVPFFHAHGLGNCVLAAVRAGATLVVEPRFEPRRALRLIEEERVSVFPAVPFVFRMLTEAAGRRSFDGSSLRLCFTAGAPLPEPVFDGFRERFGLPIRQLYGCTEAGSVAINLDPDAASTWDCVGLPMPGVSVGVVDEAGAACGPDEVGEITIAGPALGRPDRGDASAFREGRFFSGDLGRIDAKGRLTVTGRKKIFISTSVGKVDPVEVERCIGEHPLVREVVVVGVAAARGDELVKAVVVPREAGEGGPDEAELKRELVGRCRDRLAEFKVPRQIELRAEIPRSALGKVLRKHLL